MEARYSGRSGAAAYYRGGDGSTEKIWRSDFRVVSLDRIKPNIIDQFLVPKASREAYNVNLRLTLGMNKNFRQFLNANPGGNLNYWLRDVHHNMLQAITGGVSRNFNDLVESNPRPNRKDRRGMGMRRALQKADETGVASRYDGRSFEIDYNRLERVVVDDQGRPYMRAVMYGYRYTTRGMFRTASGRWSRPGETAGDPRFFTSKNPRAPQVTISFEGYGTDFIDDVFRQARNDLPSSAFWVYVNEMVRAFPRESEEYIVAAATHVGRGAGVKGGFGKPLQWTPRALNFGGKFSGFRSFQS